VVQKLGPVSRTVTYSVGNAQRVLSATDGNGTQYAMTASYAPPGGLSGVIYGQITGGFGGVTESIAYNNRLEINSIQAISSAATALNLAYCFGTFSFANGCSVPSASNNGSATGIQNNVDNGRTVSMTYDNLNHVSTAASQATSGPDCWGQAYSQPPANNATPIDWWDNLWNMYVTQCSAGGLSVSVDQTKNQINSPGYGYDSSGNGNMTNDGSYSYTYDAENRIQSANGVNYTYDGAGRRVKKSNGTLYWRSIAADVLAETDLNGNTKNEYVYFAGQRMAWWDGSGNLYYIHVDELGTTRTITKSNGTVCYDADFTPFGQEIQQTNNCPSTYNYKFTGYERDPESGLDYAFARYYNFRLGRFMTADPLGGFVSYPQTLNLYTYVANNPTNVIDPLGNHCMAGEGICSGGVDPMANDTSNDSLGNADVWGGLAGAFGNQWIVGCYDCPVGQKAGLYFAGNGLIQISISDNGTILPGCQDCALATGTFYPNSAPGAVVPPGPQTGSPPVGGPGSRPPGSPGCESGANAAGKTIGGHTFTQTATLCFFTCVSSNGDTSAGSPSFGLTFDTSIDEPTEAIPQTGIPAPLIAFGLGKFVSVGSYVTSTGPSGLFFSFGPSLGPPISVSIPVGNGNGCGGRGAGKGPG